MPETTYSYSIADDFPSAKVDAGALHQEVIDSAITIAIKGVTTDGVDTCSVVFKDALSPADESLLDGDTLAPAGGLIGAHSGDPTLDPTTSDGVPIFKMEGPSDPQDKKPVMVISPATEGYKTWLTGRGDNIAGSSRGTGPQFRLDFLDVNLPETKTIDFDFMEPLEIHDGQIQWTPKDAWGPDDEFSLGVYIPATVATPNTGNGNCNLVDSGAGYNVIVPAAGDGSHDIDLSTACPVPADVAGYWDNDYDSAVISASTTPGAANWHLLDVPISSWLMRNVSMTHEGGWFDIDVYKTEYFHPRWKLRWTVTKNTPGDGTGTGWILAFRKSTT